jgi:hypothetical protein
MAWVRFWVPVVVAGHALSVAEALEDSWRILVALGGAWQTHAASVDATTAAAPTDHNRVNPTQSLDDRGDRADSSRIQGVDSRSMR